MTLQDLLQEAQKLALAEQLELVAALRRWIDDQWIDDQAGSDAGLSRTPALQPGFGDPVLRRVWVEQLRGCLKQLDQEAPTDAAIKQWKEERLREKYLR